jgi:protein-S-isoprenylcysteine O-methyltransferase Ste14
VAASAAGIRCAVVTARGEGTPVAICGVGQTVGVALLLGRPLYYLVPPAGALLWQFVIRPSEERFLAQRFGAEYAGYRRTVPLWIPRRPRRVPR